MLTHALMLTHTITHMLTHVLTQALTHAQDAYSCVLRLLMHSLIVQYIRTGWTLLFGS